MLLRRSLTLAAQVALTVAAAVARAESAELRQRGSIVGTAVTGNPA